MSDIATQSNPQSPCQLCTPPLPPGITPPQFWFGQLVEHLHTSADTDTTYRSLGIVVGLTLNHPSWRISGWIYFVKFFWSDDTILRLPRVEEVSESELQLASLS